MCGLFGFATNEKTDPYTRRRDAWMQGMMISQFRGWDSSGVAGVKEVMEKGKALNHLHIFKRALHFLDFIDTRGAGRWLQNFNDYHYVIGHTRASTRGNTDDRNAHPFNYDHITLAHNGTVSAHVLPEKADETVDSASIALNMAKIGEKETLERLEGGFALAWYNHKDDTLNFARNENKPLGLGFLKGKNTLFFGSEWLAIHYVMSRNGLRPEMPMLAIKPYVWYKFFKEDLREWEQTNFRKYSHPLSSGGRGQWQRSPESPVIHPPLPTQQNSGGNDRRNTTPDTMGGTPTTGSGNKLSLVSVERIKHVNETLAPYLLGHGRPVMLRPKEWQAYQGEGNKTGRLVAHLLDGSHPHLPFIMNNVKREDWVSIYGAGRLAALIVNTIGQDVTKDLQVTVAENTIWQGLIQRKLSGDNFRGESKSEPSSFDESRQRWVDKKGNPVDVLGIPDGESEEEKSRPLVKGPDGKEVSEEEFRRRSNHGCGYCSADISVSMAPEVLWVNGSPICPSCVNDVDCQRDLGFRPLDERIMH